MGLDARHYATDALMRDGSSVHIRAIRPDDKPRLLDFFAHLSARSAYFRFFRTKTTLTPEELRSFTELDFIHNVTLVATLREHEEEHFVAVGHYMQLGSSAEAPARAEVAFAVADAHQGRGLGTLLLEHLAAIARDNDMSEFEAYVLGENNRMLNVFNSSGFRVKRSLESGVFHVAFPTQETEQVRTAEAERERLAAAQSVRVFFHPQSIAVVGASPRPGTIGQALFTNVKHYGFPGAIYPVNPRLTDLDGMPTFPTVSAIGAPVDLALIAVPAAAVEETIADCARAGVHGVVVISSGFAEVSDVGRQSEQRLRHLVRSAGMRMVGPNCMGLLNTAPEVSLNATFTPVWPPVGNIGMLSQSGALGLAVLDYVRTLNVGISTFVSVGNKADVSGNDLLAYWADDPCTDVIVLYLESFGNPRKFARLAPEVARRKPIIAVKSGRSSAGSRAASSHSAALANLDVAVDALFTQAGVIRTNTLEELFDVAALLATQPIPPGPRIGVVTNAGGPGILLADACEALTLTLPELAPESTAALRAFLPAQAGLSNPVDMIAAATPEQYVRTMEVVGADPNIDAVVAIYIPPQVTHPEDIAQAIAQGAALVPTHKPVLTVFISSRGAPAILSTGPRGKLPAYSFPENAAHALAAAVRYGRWRSRPRGTPFTLSSFAHQAIRAVVERVLTGVTAPLWLQPADLLTILRAAGIECAAAEQTTVADAVTTAERLGYPLVAKAISPDVLHKSDVGGVIMDLDSAATVAAAVDTLTERMRNLGARLDGILLQRQIPSGVEALVGVTTDPTFGPLVVCGLGGTLVELLRDVAFRLTPISDLDASEMLASLRASRLLDGYRGTLPADREALISVILRISALVESIPELRELDLNPVKVLPPGQGAVVIDGRIRLAPLPRSGARH